MQSDELFFAGDARHGLGSEALRRIALAAHLGTRSKVLDLGCGQGSATLLLAHQFGCAVLAADDDDSALEPLRRHIRARSLASRVEVAKVDFSALSFADGEFHLIFAPSQAVFPLSKAVQELRRYLVPKGKLVVCCPVRVGRKADSPAVQFWENRLREPLLLPREVLQVFASAGYEPETIESLSDGQLEELYRQLEENRAEIAPESAARAASLRDEIQQHRAQAGKASVSFATAVARRKEPGEKPVASRERG